MSFTFNSTSFAKTMNSRDLYTLEMARKGRKTLMTVTGNGVVTDVKDKNGENVPMADGSGEILRKKIFNVKANSEASLNNPDNKQLLKDARAAEKAGDKEKAHQLFNTFANKVQVSFSIPLPSRIADELNHNTDISANLSLVEVDLKDGKGKGYIITVDPKSIRIMEPEVAGKTTFSWDDDDADTNAAEKKTADAAFVEA